MSYNTGSIERQIYRNWATDHKTIIICNGGNSAMLQDVFTTFTIHATEFGLPLVKFHEDEQSLNEALTSVAIVVPERFYDVTWSAPVYGRELSAPAAYTHEATGQLYFEGTPEFAFIAFLKSFRLA
jgi:hypothetical protein